MERIQKEVKSTFDLMTATCASLTHRVSEPYKKITKPQNAIIPAKDDLDFDNFITTIYDG